MMKLSHLFVVCLLAASGTVPLAVLAQSDNLSIGAGSDGSSKTNGSSFGNVRDGDLSSV